MLGPLAQLLTVADGAQEAIAAALGAAAGSVVVAGLDAAVDIMTALRSQDAGRAGLVIASEVKQRGTDGCQADISRLSARERRRARFRRY